MSAQRQFSDPGDHRRVFRKVWEMACWAGFLAGRESARLMLPRGKGNIFFTALPPPCAAAAGMQPLPAPNSDCARWRKRWRASSGQETSTVAHLIIDSGVTRLGAPAPRTALGKETLDNPDLLMPPARSRPHTGKLYQQPRSAWTSSSRFARSGKSGSLKIH